MNTRTDDNSRIAWLATAGVAAIPIVVPLFEGRILLGPLPIDAVILSVIVALAAAAPYVRSRGISALPATGIALPVTAFLGIAAIGAVAYGSPSTLMTWFRYACYFALVPVVGLVAEDPLRRRVILWAVLTGGTLTLLHGTYQYLNPSAAEAIGMKELVETGVGARVYSTFENPNFYAEYLVLLFAAALALVLSEKGVLRVIAGAAIVYSGVILLLTYTRGSWIALATGVVVTIALVNWRLVVPLAAATAIGVVALPGVTTRLMSIASTEGTVSFRMRLWRIAGEVISNHPVLGVGLGDFYRGFQEVVLSKPGLGVGFTFYGAHNSYFQVTAETGLLGGLAFALTVLALCRAGFAYSLARYPVASDRIQVAALLAGTIAFSVNGLTSNSFQHPRGAVFFFVLAGVSAGIGVHAIRHGAVADRRPAKMTVFSSSFVGRTAHWMSNMIVASVAWRGLTRLPERSTMLDSSAVVTWLIGSGSENRELPGRA